MFADLDFPVFEGDHGDPAGDRWGARREDMAETITKRGEVCTGAMYKALWGHPEWLSEEYVAPALHDGGVLPELPALPEVLVDAVPIPVYPEEVRLSCLPEDSWHDGRRLSFGNPTWVSSLRLVCKRIFEALGIDGSGKHRLELRGMVMQRSGVDFPQVTTREGAFLRLLIQLPSRCSGGEIAVKERRGTSHVHSLAGGAHFCSYAAFYAGLNHSFAPLVFGSRVVLVYEIMWGQDNPAPLTGPPSVVELLADALSQWGSNRKVIAFAAQLKSHVPLEQATFGGLHPASLRTLRLLYAANNLLNPESKLRFSLGLAERRYRSMSIGGNAVEVDSTAVNQSGCTSTIQTTVVKLWRSLDGHPLYDPLALEIPSQGGIWPHDDIDFSPRREIAEGQSASHRLCLFAFRLRDYERLFEGEEPLKILTRHVIRTGPNVPTFQQYLQQHLIDYVLEHELGASPVHLKLLLQLVRGSPSGILLMFLTMRDSRLRSFTLLEVILQPISELDVFSVPTPENSSHHDAATELRIQFVDYINSITSFHAKTALSVATQLCTDNIRAEHAVWLLQVLSLVTEGFNTISQDDFALAIYNLIKDQLWEDVSNSVMKELCSLPRTISIRITVSILEKMLSPTSHSTQHPLLATSAQPELEKLLGDLMTKVEPAYVGIPLRFCAAHGSMEMLERVCRHQADQSTEHHTHYILELVLRSCGGRKDHAQAAAAILCGKRITKLRKLVSRNPLEDFDGSYPEAHYPYNSKVQEFLRSTQRTLVLECTSAEAVSYMRDFSWRTPPSYHFHLAYSSKENSDPGFSLETEYSKEPFGISLTKSPLYFEWQRQMIPAWEEELLALRVLTGVFGGKSARSDMDWTPTLPIDSPKRPRFNGV